MFLSSYKKFFSYFQKNKKFLKLYSYLSFIVGAIELFGIALTYPFVLKLLSQQPSENILNSPIIIGLGIILLFLAKNILMIYYTYLQAKFTKAVEAEVNLSFMRYFLATPYMTGMKIPLAQKSNILNFLIPNVINNFVLRLLNLRVNFFIFCLIALFLIIKFPLATILTIISSVVLIYIQNIFFKPRLRQNAEKMTKTSFIYTQRTNEAILDIKAVKISNHEIFFYNNYKSAILNYYKTGIETLFLNTIPPYVTEPFIIILLFILLSIISCQSYSEPDKLIASFAVIVSAIFRLAPTISRLQVNLNGINSSLPIVEELLKICESLDINNTKKLVNKEFTPLKSSIELRNINFEYETHKPVLRNINLTIKKGEFIGIAGLSGAGKSTLADIIAGLLIPTSGEILIDGAVSENPLKIGYIPQEFNILNESIKKNVIFGSSYENDDLVIDALKKAQLYEFIINNYKDGINANPFVDSTGFSQGQKQRLAIARAIYSNPDILILDEATSSLDLKTENEFCNVLNSLKGEKTIIAIAHRLSTIKSADRIAFMKDATITDIAAFDELYQRSDDFRELIKLASIKSS